jgi:hypothetical protein
MKETHLATRMLQPHTTLLAFLASRFQSFRYRDADLVHSCLRLVLNSSLVAETWRWAVFSFSTHLVLTHPRSTHQLARELRMRLLAFGFCVLQGSQLESTIEFNLRASLYDAALAWFAIPAGCVRVFVSPPPRALNPLCTADGRMEATASSSKPTFRPWRSCRRRSSPTRLPTATSRRALLLALFQVCFQDLWTRTSSLTSSPLRSSLGVGGGRASQESHPPPSHPAGERGWSHQTLAQPDDGSQARTCPFPLGRVRGALHVLVVERAEPETSLRRPRGDSSFASHGQAGPMSLFNCPSAPSMLLLPPRSLDWCEAIPFAFKPAPTLSSTSSETRSGPRLDPNFA